MNQMVKASLSRTGSAYSEWTYRFSTITWPLDHISPQSRILWAKVQSQNPPLSFSFLQPPPPLNFFKGSAQIFPLEPLRLIPAPLLLCTPAQKHILLFTPASPPGNRTRRELGKVLFRSVNAGVRVRVDVFDLHTPCDQWLWARAQTANGDKTEVKWRGLFRTAEARQTKQTQTVLDRLCSTADR